MGTLSPLRLGRRPVGCRVLVLFRVGRDAAGALLPPRSRPLLVDGHAVAGLCYTQLGSLTGRLLRRRTTTNSEHLAVRIAAEFLNQEGEAAPGTWILRRQTSSWIEARCGDKLLRGEYERAAFALQESPHGLTLDVHRGDREELHLEAEHTDSLAGSGFASTRQLQELLAMTGAVRPRDVFAPEADELNLQSGAVAVEPLRVREMRSVFFADPRHFPPGEAVLDCAVRLVTRRTHRVIRPVPQRRETLLDNGSAASALPTT